MIRAECKPCFRELQIAERASRTAAGLCIECDNALPEDRNGVRCLECLARNAERGKAQRKERRIHGICLDCPNQTKEGRSRCQPCLNRKAAFGRQLYRPEESGLMTEPIETPTPAEETPAPQPVALDDLVKKALQDRGVKPKCLPCGSIGWLNLQIGIVGWPTVQGMAQVALLICKKCAHLEPYDLSALGITLTAPEPSRIITADNPKPLIVTG